MLQAKQTDRQASLNWVFLADPREGNLEEHRIAQTLYIGSNGSLLSLSIYLYGIAVPAPA